MSDDLRSACHDRIRADEFRPAREIDLQRLDPCGFCFPDGEVDEPLSNLVVAPTGEWTCFWPAAGRFPPSAGYFSRSRW